MGLLTQQDPIGIAGGLNLYGYANGDPINFSDPCGLCPEEVRDNDGRCPGGLSVEEWNAVVEATQRLQEMAARQVTEKLESGDIRGHSDDRRPEGGVSAWSPDVIQINRNWNLGVPGMNASVFGSSELPRVLAHELRHTQQAEHFGLWMRLWWWWTPLQDRLESEAQSWARRNLK